MTQTSVVINDVGPRDGLQNQAKILSASERLQLIEALSQTGLPEIEVGAFVHPKAVPAMAGTDEVIAGLPDNDIRYSALIPNMRGYELSRASGIETVNLVTAASNTMNEKNIGMNNAEALSVCQTVISQAKQDNVFTMAYIATSWECPFEGEVDPGVVEDTTRELFAAGADRVVIADTIGAANPASVKQLFERLDQQFSLERIAAHFHDTRGMALANVFAAYEAGVRHFDASVGGLGGCPFAPGATGNVATEDVVLMFEKMGVATGVSLAALLDAVQLAGDLTDTKTGGHAARWLRLQRDKQLLN